MPTSTLSPSRSFTIRAVRSGQDLDDTKELFLQYAGSLGFDLAFQSFDDEMASMPGKYSPPSGELLLARDSSGKPIGCVGLRPLSGSCCEMKRLYVLPDAQGLGLGKALATEIIGKAENIGYSELKLDTIPTMIAAIKLYRKFGFVETPAYYQTAMEGTLFLSLKLPRVHDSRDRS